MCWGLTIGHAARGTLTARSSWTWSDIASSTSWRTVPPTRSLPGCKGIRRWRSSAAIVEEPTLREPDKARRRRGNTHFVGTRDRWHLLCNLGDALERLLAREHDSLRRAGDAVGRQTEPVASAAAAPTGETSPGEISLANLPVTPAEVAPAPTAAERDRAAHRQRRLARYDEVTALQAQGLGIATIAKRLGMARKTVRRFLRADGFPERLERSGPSGRLAAFEAYLQQRWEEGCRNASLMWNLKSTSVQ